MLRSLLPRLRVAYAEDAEQETAEVEEPEEAPATNNKVISKPAAAAEPEDEEKEEEEEEEEEEELVDAKKELAEHCAASHCTKLQAKLDACNARVTGKSRTKETCTQELFDFLHCVDHCVSKDLIKKLK